MKYGIPLLKAPPKNALVFSKETKEITVLGLCHFAFAISPCRAPLHPLHCSEPGRLILQTAPPGSPALWLQLGQWRHHRSTERGRRAIRGCFCCSILLLGRGLAEAALPS